MIGRRSEGHQPCGATVHTYDDLVAPLVGGLPGGSPGYGFPSPTISLRRRSHTLSGHDFVQTRPCVVPDDLLELRGTRSAHEDGLEHRHEFHDVDHGELSTSCLGQ